MTKYFIALTALLAVGCGDKENCDSGGCDTGADDGGGTVDGAEVSVTWGASDVTIAITGGDAAGYILGMAETGSCSDCWTGEDCYLGYTTGTGDVYNYCHPVSSVGATLSVVGDLADIVEGSTTILDGNTMAITYALWDSAGACTAFGDDSMYYTMDAANNCVSGR